MIEWALRSVFIRLVKRWFRHVLMITGSDHEGDEVVKVIVLAVDEETFRCFFESRWKERDDAADQP